LTQGRWDEDWGVLPSNGEMAGGTGMEIWAWIDDQDADTYYPLMRVRRLMEGRIPDGSL